MVLALGFAAPLAADMREDLAAAGDAYKRKEYPTALHLLLPLGAQGLVNAQNVLGYMYYRGLGVPSDFTEAAKWYRLAAAQGNAEAQYSVGYLYSLGHGVPKDDVEAVK